MYKTNWVSMLVFAIILLPVYFLVKISYMGLIF
jgi:hypothetical protein